MNWHSILLLAVALLGATPANADAITAKMRAADRRLEKRVTLTGYRFYVGELLEKLSAQTGVRLTALDRDGTAGDRVSVILRNIPLADALNAVRSTFSYEGARYEWEQTADTPPAPYSYRIKRPESARRFDTFVTEAIQKDFEAEVRGKVAALKMSPEERRKAEEENPRLKMTPRGEAAIGAIGALLPPDQLSDILRGDDFRVSADQLGDTGKRFLASEEETHRRASEGVANSPGIAVVPWISPSALVVLRRQSADELVPTLYIFLARPEKPGDATSTVLIGVGWAGGAPAEAAWKDKLRQWWRTLPGGELPETLRNKTLTAPEKPESDENYPGLLFQRLHTLAQAAPFSVITRVPHRSDDPGSPIGLTVDQYLKRLEAIGLDYKWTDHALVITHYRWIQREPEARKIPWELMKHLRARAEDDAARFLSFSDVCQVASMLSVAQLEGMCEPENWWYDRWEIMRRIIALQPILKAFDKHPEWIAAAQSAEGIPLASLPPSVAQFLKEQSPQSKILRLKFIENLAQKVRRADFTLHERDGKEIASASMDFYPWPLPLSRRPVPPPATAP